MDFKKLLVTSLLSLLCHASLSAQNWRPYEGTPQQHLKNGKPEEALRMMKSNPKWIRTGDRLGQKPIHYAAGLGNLGLARWLLQNEADIDAKTRDGRTALFFAKTSEIAELLLEEGANINAMNRLGETPLFLVGTLELANVLLSSTPDLEHRNRYGKTALQSISGSIDGDLWRAEEDNREDWRKTRTKVSLALIDAGADYDLESAVCLGDLEWVKRKFSRDAKQEYSDSLKLAVQKGQVEICKFLFDIEEVDCREPLKGYEPLFHSALKHPELVRLFIENGADVNAKLKLHGGMSGMHIIGFEALVIHHAVNIGAPPRSIKLILDAGAGPFDECESMESPLVEDKKEFVTPLDVAFFCGNAETILALVSHPKFQMDEERKRQELFDRCLMRSFGMENSCEVTQLLLDKGANPMVEINGYTALEANWFAFDLYQRKGDSRNEECSKVAKLLMSNGAKQGLMTAIMLGDEESAVTLLQDGSKLRHEKLEFTAFGKCIKEQRVKLLTGLLGSGIKVKKGPLRWAAVLGHQDIVRLLLQHGADVDGIGRGYYESRGYDSFPLHGAVRAGHLEIVEILLRHGADPCIKDKKGETPIQKCKNPELRLELERLFEKHLAVKKEKAGS